MLTILRVLLLVVMGIFAVTNGYAATFTVDTATDAVDSNPGNGVCATSGNNCSLRAAVQEANALAGADIITLPAGIYQLTITGTGEEQAASGDLDIRTDITINGDDPRTTFVQAGNGPGLGIDRVFEVPSAAVGILTLNSVTVRYGTDSTGIGGGGLQLNVPGAGATINLNNVLVTQNSTSGNGGAMRASGGTVNILNSTFLNNSLTGTGTGGFAICNNLCTMRLTNSTISGNSAGSGGAVRNTSGTSLTLTNCTITGNTGSAGTGGIHTSGTTNIRNTIISLNTGTTDNDVTGTVVSGGTNLIRSVGTSAGWVGSDLQNNVNGRLTPIGDYGGTTPTHSLLSTSSAINAGSNCVNNSSCATFNAPANVTTDQRGFSRPASSTTDIGSVEVPASPTDFAAVLPTGRQNQAYGATVAPNTTYGLITYTYSLFGGDTLPAGLSLTTAFAPAAAQQITGIPTVNGTFFFRIQVSDGVNTQVTRYQLNLLAPTAASVSIAGRVRDANGRGIGKAMVIMTFADGSTEVTMSNPFGHYRFNDVAVGQTVVLNVKSKSRTFPSTLVNVSEDMNDLDFWALD